MTLEPLKNSISALSQPSIANSIPPKTASGVENNKGSFASTSLSSSVKDEGQNLKEVGLKILTFFKGIVLLPFQIARGIFLSLLGLFFWIPPVRILIEWMVLPQQVKKLSKTIDREESDKDPTFKKKEALQKEIGEALDAVKYEEDRAYFYELLVKHLIDGRLISIVDSQAPQRHKELANEWLDKSYSAQKPNHQTALHNAMVGYRRFLSS